MKRDYRIDRSKWVCGSNPIYGQNQMLNNIGRMCCLGQICNQSKISKDRLLGIEEPCDVDMSGVSVPDWLIDELNSSYIAETMMIINDNIFIDQKARERLLKSLAKEVGIKLSFYGKLKDGPMLKDHE